MSQNKVERIWTHKLLNIKYIFFILIYLIFIISLVLSTSINMGKIPFILSVLFIIYYLVFRIDFRLTLSFCLLMLLSLPVLLITNNYKIADRIANYAYFLLLFTVLSTYLNEWREKLKKIGKEKDRFQDKILRN
ncbi:hypothetical protein ES703_18768 [subsurface metagenome]